MRDNPDQPIRTRFFDDWLLAVTGRESIRQVVLLAAGMDSRAFRLAWPPGTAMWELDQPERLVGAGLQPALPSAWLAEGFFEYLDAAAFERVLAALTRLAAHVDVFPMCDSIDRDDSPWLAWSGLGPIQCVHPRFPIHGHDVPGLEWLDGSVPGVNASRQIDDHRTLGAEILILGVLNVRREENRGCQCGSRPESPSS